MASNLQSKDHRELLDTIDRLRSRGMGKYVDLPQIIVCGDQSCGKSSVLEAIAQRSFPTMEGLCTCFATELILRRNDTAGIKVSIIPGPERSPREKERFSDFKPEVDSDSPDLGSIIEEAKIHMGISHAKRFSTDILRVELFGPSQPHLTIVDLPGLFRAGSREQSVNDADLVKRMVEKYMQQSRSVILAVVCANYDMNLQEVTEFTRKLDPKGDRTLGLITKPDKLERDSGNESFFLRLAKNEDIVFRLGWHVLMNPFRDMSNKTYEERDNEEEAFFSSGVWQSVDPNSIGVKALRPRLSNILKNQILNELPNLMQHVNSGIADCRQRLQSLGTARTTLEERREYLVHISQQFSFLMQAAVDGDYTQGAFFGSARTKEGEQKRLRANVQNRLIAFEEKVRTEGESRRIVDNIGDSIEGSGTPPTISRSKYIEDVKILMRKSKGRELSGTFNPLFIGELFIDHCQPWRSLVIAMKDEMMHFVFQVTKNILDHTAARDIAQSLFGFISLKIDGLKKSLEAKITELLDPFYLSHAITYNHYLTDTVQKVQQQRQLRMLQGALDKYPNYKCSAEWLAASLQGKIEVDMETNASNLVVDYMQAYYKVAFKRMIDDVSVLAIENCLLQPLSGLFNSKVVSALSDDEIITLTEESKDNAAERARHTERLSVLEGGLADLKRLGRHRLVSMDSEEDTKSEVGEEDIVSLDEIVKVSEDEENGEDE